MSNHRSMLPFVILLSALFSAPAHSQDESTEDQKVEKISVTGSFIKKIDVQGIAPLESISNEEFTKRGAVEIGDVFRETPAFESVYSDGGHVRFRGQHAGNVLILLNGLRMPKLDGGYYTSIRDLPTAAIGQVEMLKDSGSATYGSDAMSGVINFKTKTDYDGAEIQTGFSRAEMTSQGFQQNYSATYGKNFSRGNIMGVVQFEKTKAVTEFELGSYTNRTDDYSNSKVSSADLDNDRNLDVGGTCIDGSAGPCETNPLFYQQHRPDNHDISTLLTGSYEFDNFNVSFLGLYNRNETTSLSNPQSVRWIDGTNSSISGSDLQTTRYNSYLNGNGNLEVDGSFEQELGDYVTEKIRETYSFQGRAGGYFGSSDWGWEVQSGISIADSEATVVSGEANQNILKDLVESGDFLLDAPTGQRSNVDSAKINPTYRNNSFLFQTRAMVTGDVYNLGDLYSGGGYVSMAAGVEIQKEDFEFDNDASLSNGAALAQTSANFEGSRDIKSIFAEFSISPLESLEVSLASRFDEYSDMGGTFNPKLGLSYRPADFILFRSSVGTGFRAPGITDVYSRETTGIQGFTDGTNGQYGFYNVTEFNDTDLDPEEALTYNFGTVIQPFKNVTFLIDQWNYEGENVITSIDADDFTDIENRSGTEALDDLGVVINRDGSGNITSMRIPNVVNVGKRTLRGLDTQLDIKFNLFADYELKFGSNLMYIFERTDEGIMYTEKRESQKTWKNRTYLSMYNQTHFARLSLLTVSRDRQGQFSRNEIEIPSYHELDFSYSYTWKWGGKLNFTVKNLMNSRAQPNKNYDPIRYGYLSQAQSSFSPLRRRYYVGYTHTF